MALQNEVIISPLRRKMEILAVAITGLGKFVFMDLLEWRLPYILTACLGWLFYVLIRNRQVPGVLQYWGFHQKNFGRTFLLLLPFAVLLVSVFLIMGERMGTNRLNWGIVPIMLLYPIWGIIQQFLIVGLVGRNLHDIPRPQLPIWATVLLTATLFALVHFPFVLLVLATFGLAIVYTYLYLRGHNLLVLGIYHGWLGGFFFYTMLDRDPWQEVFGVLFSG